MSIGFQCPGCQRPYNVDSALAGKRVRCKQCGNEMRVPTPSRPASAPPPPPKTKAKPPPVPADIYGFDDEPAGPMPARMPPIATMEPERRPSPKKRKRRSSDEGPWGVPLRWAAFMLFVFTTTWLKMIREGKVDESTFFVARITVWAALITMIVSVVGASVSFFRGNRSAFRGESILGQIAWGWAILGLSISGMIALSQAGESSSEPLPLAETERADQSVFDNLARDFIASIHNYAEGMNQPQPPVGEPEDWLMLKSRMNEMDQARNRSKTLPLPTSEQVGQLKASHGNDFRAALVHLRDAASNGLQRFDDDTTAAEYFRDVVTRTSQYLEKYDTAYPAGSDHSGWYFAVFSRDAGASAGDLAASDFEAPRMPEIPQNVLRRASPRPAPLAERMVPPPNFPRGPANFGPAPGPAPGPTPPPDLALPGGPPRPPGMDSPRGPRPPGFPGPPPRPNFPRPPRFGPPDQ